MELHLQENLVIHAGELIDVSRALKLMLEEFTPFGYSQEAVETFVSRAYNATQKFLFELSFLAPEHQQTSLEMALRKDAQIAAHWRAQSREAREAHAAKIEAERVRHQKAYEERMARQWKEQEALRAERIRAHTKNQWKEQVERWHDLNETGGRDANAEARALQRKMDDQAKMVALMQRIAARHRVRRRGIPRGGSHALDCLSDHDYIEWMFGCFTKPSRRWLGGMA